MFEDEVLNLPWWQDAVNLTVEQWKNQAFQKIYLRELEERINQHPVTPLLIRLFLNKHISVIEIKDYSSLTTIESVEEPLVFRINLAYNTEEDYKKLPLNLLHEICHGIYRTGSSIVFPREYNDGTKTRAGLEEELLDAEAKRVFEQHKAFVHHIRRCCRFYKKELIWVRTNP